MDYNNEKISTEEKIKNAKEKLATVKQIEKLEKEVLRLNKTISNKTAKIAELAEQL